MIVVTTPTGSIGGRVVESLLKRDQAVLVIVRDPAKLSSTVRERVDVVQGSHGEPRASESTTPTTFRRWCETVLKPGLSN